MLLAASGRYTSMHKMGPTLSVEAQTTTDIKHETRQEHGSVSNSDGEAAAVLLQEVSLEHWTGCITFGISTHMGSDNSPTVGWNNLGASRASHKAPETMIWCQALRRRFTRRGPTDVEHIPGKTNLFGDFPSRSFEEGFPDGTEGDAKFLLEFSRRHPLLFAYPQQGKICYDDKVSNYAETDPRRGTIALPTVESGSAYSG